jgi:hypothetical protein
MRRTWQRSNLLPRFTGPGHRWGFLHADVTAAGRNTFRQAPVVSPGRGTARSGNVRRCAYKFSLMCYFVQEWPAIVQAVSAAIVAYLTYRLVLATATYARITRETLALNNRQFEQELLPNWHISFTPTQPGIGMATLEILNLSRNSARVTHLFIRAESEDEPETRRFPLDLGIPSGHYETTADVAPFILETVRPYRHPLCTPFGRSRRRAGLSPRLEGQLPHIPLLP